MKKKTREHMDEREQPLLSHLEELRLCIIKAVLGLVLSMGLCYVFVDHIMYVLKKPMTDLMPQGSSFVVLSPQEYFFTELKAALFFGFIFSCPWLFYQLWIFIAPGLYKQEKRILGFFVVSASLFFVMGTLFAYFLVFPPAFQYFLASLPEGVTGAYSVAMLYGFAISVLLAFGVIFQTPIAVLLLVKLAVVSVEKLASLRRFVFVGAFIVGAILTPPDPLTQIMLAIPAYALFEIGLLMARLIAPKT